MTIKPPVFEVYEFNGDSVKRIAMCGSEADARMMISNGGPHMRSCIRCDHLELLHCTEGDK